VDGKHLHVEPHCGSHGPGHRVARIRRTISGPAAVNSSLPILKPPTTGAIFLASSRAASAVGTSSAAMIGLRAMQPPVYDKPPAKKTIYCVDRGIFLGAGE
jgi:hypothetical protein